MKKIIAAIFTVLLCQNSFGQNSSPLISLSDESYFEDGQKLNFVRLKESQQVEMSAVTAFINTQVFENGINKAVLVKTERDEQGFTHLKYAIYQNGVMLANKVILAHCKNEKLISLNGDLVNVAKAENGFSLTEKSALNFALAKVNAKKYKWQNKEEEAHMREALNQTDFTYYPHGTKVLFEKAGKVYTAYQFNIYAETPLYRANVYVNASNGKILDEHNLICNADVPGSAATKYSGTQNFTCDQNGSTYRLRETQRGLGIETYNLNYGSTYNNTDFTNSSTSWTVVNADQGARDAHWGAEKTYDYFLSQHNRNSINNAGYKLLSYIHYQTNYQNAFWDGQRMTYGDGVNGKMFATLDICGHEITHGLTSNTGNMTYQNESGALNESFSDIFAACIENYGRPTNWNWKMGEDLSTNPASSNAGFRNMASPNMDSNPDTYLGTYYYTGTQDNGGVHTNSGVSNFWFYLLTTGGSGTNDIGNAYSVTGIGMTNAAKIAFRALTVYFTPSTNFMTARNLSIQAAKDLFGTCSIEVEQTTRAWYAVGVGANFSATNLGTAFITNGTNFCSVPSSVSFTNQTVNGLTYTWYFGDGATASGTNTAHTYTAPGVYTVKLKAIGCANAADSVVKNAYITVNGPVSSPLVSGGNACTNNSATLSASGSGTIKWYDNQFGGLLLGVGNSFVTPTLNASTSYYAENSLTLAPVSGGMLSNTGGGYLNNATQYMVFDVTQSSVLSSVVVYAQTIGARIIELRSSGNVILDSRTVTLSIGANTVNLNFNLNPGSNYRLALGLASASSLYRSTTGVNYPYNIGGSVNIKTSSAGTANYYYFYNWKIQRLECASARFPGLAVVNPLPAVSISAPSTVVCLSDQSPITGSPLGGTYSGNNLPIGSVFNPSSLGTGNYMVTYSYTDNNGCSDSTYTEVRIEECTSITKENTSSPFISVFPNPAKDVLVIKHEALQANTRFVLSDASGRIIFNEVLSTTEHTLDLSPYAKGMYLLMIQEGGSTLRSIKVIKD